MNLNNEKLHLSTIMFRLKHRRYLRKKQVAETARVKKSMSLVEKKLEKWVEEGRYRNRYDSIDEILDELGITGDELRFYCSSRFHKCFLSWRKELRIEAAKEMLTSCPEMPVSKICNALGITDKSDFRHQFKSATGMTPKEWREKFQKKS